MSASIPVFGSMTNFDRFQFAFTIASHITLVLMSVSLIITIVIAEFLSVYRSDESYAILARRLTKVFTISFGVGTASGIVMAVELVILFPPFMTVAAQTGVIELFYFEVFAFFLETLFLVLYVYYATAFKGRYTHVLVGAVVAAGTLVSAVLIVTVNAWMNTPNGLDASALVQGLAAGKIVVTGVQPWAPFTNPSAFAEIVHVLATTVFTGSMITAGYFAYRILRYRKPEESSFLSRGLRITWATSFATLVLAGISGSNEMATLLRDQPLKYAALDANTVAGSGLPERVFGSITNGVWSGGLQIPGLQSFLASFETGVTSLPGLNQFPSSIWPPLYVHETFDLMIFGAFVALGYFFIYVFGWALKKKPFEARWLLYLQIPAAVGSYLLYLFGWVTDEVGRQPFIVYNLVTVAQAANQSTSVVTPGLLIMAFYVLVVPSTFYFFIRVFNSGRPEEAQHANEGGAGVNY